MNPKDIKIEIRDYMPPDTFKLIDQKELKALDKSMYDIAKTFNSNTFSNLYHNPSNIHKIIRRHFVGGITYVGE